MKLIYSILPTTILLFGCVSTPLVQKNKSYVKVFFDSSPKGAMVICDRENGYTPRMVTLKYTEKELASGVGFLPRCELKWASGATVVIKKKRIKLSRPGLSYSVNNKGFQENGVNFVKRPNVPGYENDALFALKLENLRAVRAQARATRARSIRARAIQAPRMQASQDDGRSIRTIHCQNHPTSNGCRPRY